MVLCIKIGSFVFSELILLDTSFFVHFVQLRVNNIFESPFVLIFPQEDFEQFLLDVFWNVDCNMNYHFLTGNLVVNVTLVFSCFN